jgi:hypothetical protein
MQVLFKSRNPRATELRDPTERRVRFVLRRLGWLVPHAEVHMSDVNGPRGGVDKRCQVALKTDVAGTVVVASVASEWGTALNQALAKAARFLMRLLRRGTHFGRGRQRSRALLEAALPAVAHPDNLATPPRRPTTERLRPTSPILL